MATTIHRKVIGLAVAAVWLFSTAGLSAKPPLRLVLETQKDEYLIYEPVVVSYRLINDSGQPVQVPVSIAPSVGNVRFEIAGEEGTYRPYLTGAQILTEERTVGLEPGRAHASQLIVLTNALGKVAEANPHRYTGTRIFPLAETGEIHLRASYYHAPASTWIQSDVLKLSVGEPGAELDVVAEFSGAKDYAAAVGADYTVRDLTEAAQRWEQIARTHPESTYTPFVAFHVAELYLHGTGQRYPDPGRASELFTLALDHAPASFQDDCLLALAKSEVQAGAYDDAKASVERLLREFPDSEHRASALRLKAGIAKGHRTLADVYGN